MKLGVVMDPIGSVNLKKDSTLAMLHEANNRGWAIHYLEQADLYLRDGMARGRARRLSVDLEGTPPYYKLGADVQLSLADLDVILMRKDPPYTLEYLYTTLILEQAEAGGTLVVNRARALRDANEKLSATWFPQCIPPTLVARDAALIRQFLGEHRDVVIKPLDAMGGASVFRLRLDDPNVSVVIEIMTDRGQRFTMVQRFIPEIAEGDKRILLVDGEPVPYALARVPAPGETRGNLAAGGTGVGVPLTVRDRWICEQAGPMLRDRGLIFVGLDVIGDYLTEINVTSPTCIRELDKLYDLNISAHLLDVIAAKVASRTS